MSSHILDGLASFGGVLYSGLRRACEDAAEAISGKIFRAVVVTLPNGNIITVDESGISRSDIRAKLIRDGAASAIITDDGWSVKVDWNTYVVTVKPD